MTEQAAPSQETTAVLLPFYVLVDVSYSMTAQFGGGLDAGPPQTGIDAVNGIAPEVAAVFDTNPLLRDKVRFGLVDFSGQAEVRIPLCDVAQLGNIPRLQERTDGTSYANAFRAMRSLIETDVAQLKADGFKVHRPTVFFLTDGEPTDMTDGEWQTAFAELTDPTFRARPNFVPFGVRDASKQVLDQLAKYKTVGGKPPQSFLASENVSAAEAIGKMAELLVGSIVESANSLQADGTDGGWQFPDPSEDEEDDGGDWT